MKKLLIANWKLNPAKVKDATALFAAAKGIKNIKETEVVVCPPYPFLSLLAKDAKGSKVMLGAQNMFWEEEGAYTGEVSIGMLQDFGVRYVIIGHSERRRVLLESDEMVAKKVELALKHKLRVVLCVGEPEIVRKKGMRAAIEFVKKQLALDLAKVEKVGADDLVIAYEPIWAISGTGGMADSPSEAIEVVSVIKDVLSVKLKVRLRVIYGGSVTSKNVHSFVHYDGVDGALVGGASLSAKEFKKIVEIVEKI